MPTISESRLSMCHGTGGAHPFSLGFQSPSAFVASAVDGQDTETVMKLYGLSRDNLYQIRNRLTAKLREVVAKVLEEMDSPGAPGPRP